MFLVELIASSFLDLISKQARSLLFFFVKLLYAKPKHASGKAASREKRGRNASINVNPVGGGGGGAGKGWGFDKF